MFTSGLNLEFEMHHSQGLELDTATEKETEAQRREVVSLTSHRIWKARDWDLESWIFLPHCCLSSHHWGVALTLSQAATTYLHTEVTNRMARAVP